MKVLLYCALPLMFAACAHQHTASTTVTRSSSETLRARPVGTYAVASASRRLNYPRPGEFRSFGTVEVASNAYSTGGELPMIADYDPTAEVDQVSPLSYERVYVNPEARSPYIRTIIRNDGTVAEGNFRVTPLGPQGTNRAVINQITGLPVDR